MKSYNKASLLLIEKYYRKKYNKQPHHTLIVDEYNNIHKGYSFHYSSHIDFNYTDQPSDTMLNNIFQHHAKFNKKKYQVHRLICQAFKWDLVKQKFDQQNEYTDIYSFWNSLEVNHIDTNPQNNHIINLEPLTKSEHRKITNHNVKKRAKTQSKPIFGKKDGDWVLYSSISAAARELKGIEITSIHKCCNTGKNINGYQFKYAPDPDLEGEVWKYVPQKFFKYSVKGWRVSNKGRVHSKKTVKSYGSKHGKYKSFGNNILVHRAVAAAFMEDKIMEVLRSI